MVWDQFLGEEFQPKGYIYKSSISGISSTMMYIDVLQFVWQILTIVESKQTCGYFFLSMLSSGILLLVYFCKKDLNGRDCSLKYGIFAPIRAWHKSI